MSDKDKSGQLFSRAKLTIPGGVNSPVRAFKSVDLDPIFIDKGEGSYIFDVDGNRYIDYVLSWGPLILGHCHPAVIEAVKSAAEKGLSFGAATEAEVELAEMIIDRFPAAEMVRLVSSGTEACMTAVRLARGYTGRDIIVKFDGCYHGHSDSLLVKAGSGVATGGIPGTKGIPAGTAKTTLSIPYNDIEAVGAVFESKGEDIAAVIVEPIAANMGVVPPQEGFLENLRMLTAKYGSLLIFDEVITGFRVARGGACELFGIVPDLICLGKILGGGMPIGGLCGKREIMEKLAPVGDVYQAGTLSGNPVSTAAGLATLRELDKAGVYENLKLNTEKLSEGLNSVFSQPGIDVHIASVLGLLTVFFSSKDIVNFQDVTGCDNDKFKRFFQSMLASGIYLPPSPFEAWFLSIKHDDDIIGKTIEAADRAVKTL